MMLLKVNIKNSEKERKIHICTMRKKHNNEIVIGRNCKSSPSTLS